jgi:hypothetical protein
MCRGGGRRGRPTPRGGRAVRTSPQTNVSPPLVLTERRRRDGVPRRISWDPEIADYELLGGAQRRKDEKRRCRSQRQQKEQQKELGVGVEDGDRGGQDIWPPLGVFGTSPFINKKSKFDRKVGGLDPVMPVQRRSLRSKPTSPQGFLPSSTCSKPNPFSTATLDRARVADIEWGPGQPSS